MANLEHMGAVSGNAARANENACYRGLEQSLRAGTRVLWLWQVLSQVKKQLPKEPKRKATTAAASPLGWFFSHVLIWL